MPDEIKRKKSRIKQRGRSRAKDKRNQPEFRVPYDLLECQKLQRPPPRKREVYGSRYLVQ